MCMEDDQHNASWLCWMTCLKIGFSSWIEYFLELRPTRFGKKYGTTLTPLHVFMLWTWTLVFKTSLSPIFFALDQ